MLLGVRLERLRGGRRPGRARPRRRLARQLPRTARTARPARRARTRTCGPAAGRPAARRSARARCSTDSSWPTAGAWLIDHPGADRHRQLDHLPQVVGRAGEDGQAPDAGPVEAAADVLLDAPQVGAAPTARRRPRLRTLQQDVDLVLEVLVAGQPAAVDVEVARRDRRPLPLDRCQLPDRGLGDGRHGASCCDRDRSGSVRPGGDPGRAVGTTAMVGHRRAPGGAAVDSRGPPTACGDALHGMRRRRGSSLGRRPPAVVAAAPAPVGRTAGHGRRATSPTAASVPVSAPSASGSSTTSSATSRAARAASISSRAAACRCSTPSRAAPRRRAARSPGPCSSSWVAPRSWDVADRPARRVAEPRPWPGGRGVGAGVDRRSRASRPSRRRRARRPCRRRRESGSTIARR